MRRKFLLTMIIVMSIVSGCGSDVYTNKAESNYNTEYQILLNSGSCFVYTFKDEATGVWYIVSSKGVTPRLNADGTLYTE